MRECRWSDQRSPTIEPPNEVSKNKLKKIGDLGVYVPLTMSNLIGKGKEDVIVAPKEIKKANNAQTDGTTQPSKEVLEIAPLQVIFLEIGKGKSSKSTNPSKRVFILVCMLLKLHL